MTELATFILIDAAFIGLLMEYYKKSFRKDKAKVWEIRVVAIVASNISGALVWFFSTPPKIVNNTPLLILLYTFLVYILQLPACMKIWKPVLKLGEENLGENGAEKLGENTDTTSESTTSTTSNSEDNSSNGSEDNSSNGAEDTEDN